jgi:hypothetical protein
MLCFIGETILRIERIDGPALYELVGAGVV